MKLVKVLIPFVDGSTGKRLDAGAEAELSEDTIEKALAINPNMVLVLRDVEAVEAVEVVEEPKKPRTKAKKE